MIYKYFKPKGLLAMSGEHEMHAIALLQLLATISVRIRPESHGNLLNSIVENVEI